MTTYNNVLGVFSYAAHTLANTLWSERALSNFCSRNLLNRSLLSVSGTTVTNVGTSFCTECALGVYVGMVTMMNPLQGHRGYTCLYN